MLGSAAAFLMLTYGAFSMRSIFLLSAVPGVLALVAVLAGVGTARDPITARAGAPKLSLKPFTRRFRLYLAALAVFALGNSSDAFLLLRAKELGVAVSSLPLIWIVFHAVKSIASIPGGALSDRVGRTTLIFSGWALYAVVYVAFAFASRPLHAWLLFLGYGLFYGLTEGVEKAFIADLVPANLRGTAFGIYHFTLGVVALPSSLVCGFLWNTFSSRVALGTGAALAGAAAMVLMSLPRESES